MPVDSDTARILEQTVGGTFSAKLEEEPSVFVEYLHTVVATVTDDYLRGKICISFAAGVSKTFHKATIHLSNNYRP